MYACILDSIANKIHRYSIHWIFSMVWSDLRFHSFGRAYRCCFFADSIIGSTTSVISRDATFVRVSFLRHRERLVHTAWCSPISAGRFHFLSEKSRCLSLYATVRHGYATYRIPLGDERMNHETAGRVTRAEMHRRKMVEICLLEISC